MDKVLNLVNALNNAKDNVSFADDGVHYREYDETGKLTAHLFIKLRPVADEDGVERKKFVAREQ